MGVSSVREEAMFLLCPPLLSLDTHLGSRKPKSLPSTTHSSFSFLYFFSPFFYIFFSSNLIHSKFTPFFYTSSPFLFFSFSFLSFYNSYSYIILIKFLIQWLSPHLLLFMAFRFLFLCMYAIYICNLYKMEEL